jgi:hypothetical protein
MKMNKEQEMEMKQEMEQEGKKEKESEGEEYESESESEDMGMEGDYKAQCDANDLLRAAEIKADPARMKAALEILGQKKKAIDSMEKLMSVRKDKMMKKES